MTTLKEFIERECELVVQQVCGSHSVEKNRLLGTARAANVVAARREAMRLLLERGFTLKHIAWGLKRHRGTVYHWCANEKFRESRREKSRAYHAKHRQSEEWRARRRAYEAKKKLEVYA